MPVIRYDVTRWLREGERRGYATFWKAKIRQEALQEAIDTIEKHHKEICEAAGVKMYPEGSLSPYARLIEKLITKV